VFGANGWPSINGGKGATTQAIAPAAARAQKDVTSFREEFDGSGELPPGWQWPIGRKPLSRVAGGKLTLTATDEAATAVQSITVPSFVAETAIDPRGITKGAFAGIMLFGDRANHLALVTDGKKIQVWNQRRSERTIVAESAVQPGVAIRLRVAAMDGNRFRFAVEGVGSAWTELAGETDGSFLPPWDRGLRAGVYVAGEPAATGSFDYFTAIPDGSRVLAK
jgi:xylan 1,4-beta-xylosidase